MPFVGFGLVCAAAALLLLLSISCQSRLILKLEGGIGLCGSNHKWAECCSMGIELLGWWVPIKGAKKWRIRGQIRRGLKKKKKEKILSLFDRKSLPTFGSDNHGKVILDLFHTPLMWIPRDSIWSKQGDSCRFVCTLRAAQESEKMH